jgi:hypothetical protein
VATDMLGRYLAIAQEDGRAWLQMGRIYLLDARDWHTQHAGEPDATLYLEFAGASLEMAGRFVRDSGAVFRGMVEMERATLVYEDSGWVATQRVFVARGLPLLPPAMRELGDNLLASCPSGGILVTGGDTETLSAWYAALLRTSKEPIVPVRPDLVLEVLGVSMIPTNFLAPPAPVMRFNSVNRAYMFVWSVPLRDRWAAQKEIWYDLDTKLPRLVLLFDENLHEPWRHDMEQHDQTTGSTCSRPI